MGKWQFCNALLRAAFAAWGIWMVIGWHKHEGMGWLILVVLAFFQLPTLIRGGNMVAHLLSTKEHN